MQCMRYEGMLLLEALWSRRTYVSEDFLPVFCRGADDNDIRDKSEKMSDFKDGIDQDSTLATELARVTAGTDMFSSNTMWVIGGALVDTNSEVILSA